MARMVWADRDAPGGRVDLWNQQAWVPPSEFVADDGGQASASRWIYPAGTPLFPTTRGWHDADGVADAFWGPSVHWNTYLSQYVMLLNRTSDVNFTPEGIYVSVQLSAGSARAMVGAAADPAGRILVSAGGWARAGRHRQGSRAGGAAVSVGEVQLFSRIPS